MRQAAPYRSVLGPFPGDSPRRQALVDALEPGGGSARRRYATDGKLQDDINRCNTIGYDNTLMFKLKI